VISSVRVVAFMVRDWALICELMNVREADLIKKNSGVEILEEVIKTFEFEMNSMGLPLPV
jgi:hypothetical protein